MVPPAGLRAYQQLLGSINAMIRDEGAAVAVDISRLDGSTVDVQSASVLYGPDVPQEQRQQVWARDAPMPPVPQIVLANE